VGLSPNFKELVKIGGNNTKVAQPLQERNVRALGPVENALIEREDAVVAVQQGGCLWRIRGDA
jgi:hypothetical protein